MGRGRLNLLHKRLTETSPTGPVCSQGGAEKRRFCDERPTQQKKKIKFLFSRLDFLSNCVHNVYVEIIGKLKLQEFWKRYNQAKKPLETWVCIVEKANWKNFAQIRQTYGSADLVVAKKKGRRYVVFNIGGTKYRLITSVRFGSAVYILDVLPHDKYDKENLKDS